MICGLEFDLKFFDFNSKQTNLEYVKCVGTFLIDCELLMIKKGIHKGCACFFAISDTGITQ